MTTLSDDSVGRRSFLLNLAWLLGGSVAFAQGARGDSRGTDRSEDAPGTHNMLVVGEKTVFLSHLPMFDGVSDDQTKFTSPHRYQVILEASFANGDEDVTSLYTADRHAHASTRIYTLQPETFVLSRLFAPAKKPSRSRFKATVFRGHLEQKGVEITDLKDTLVTVNRVVHAHAFDPRAKKPEQLEYIVFGKGSELLLAHSIVGPPDFDHVLSARFTGHAFSDAELRRNVRVVFPGRKNVVGERVRAGEQVAGTVRISGAGSAAPLPVAVQADVEFYFEEGELRVPPTFKPTDEERKATP